MAEDAKATPTKPPCWPDDPDYLDGFTELFLPSETYLKAYWDCDIRDDDKDSHDTIIESNVAFGVRFRVELKGRLWKCMCGHWCFDIGFTAIGDGDDFNLSDHLPADLKEKLRICDWEGCETRFLSALRKANLDRVSNHPTTAISHYQRAVELYRGSLFEDDSTGDWYLAEQRHLNELYLQALEGLGEIYLDLEEPASAQKFAQLALARDPCCESVHRLLMKCYAAEHKQQLVSRQYSICVKALRDELGVSPGTETLRLFHDLTSASS